MILTVCLNPTIQKTLVFGNLKIGTINRTAKHYIDISGKGINVTRVLVALGEKAIHVTHLGGDFIDFFVSKARLEHIRLHAIKTTTDIRFCITIIEQETGKTTEIVEDGNRVGAGTELKILRTYKRLLPRCRSVIISGSKAAGYSDGLFPEMIRLARIAGTLVIADMRGADLINSIKYGPQFIKPNWTEFTETFFPKSRLARHDDAIQKLVEEKLLELARKHHIQAVITDGGNPIVYSDESRVKHFIPQALLPVNPIGCGDAFAAGFTSRLLKTKNVDEAVQFGEKCAARNALQERPGFLGPADLNPNP